MKTTVVRTYILLLFLIICQPSSIGNQRSLALTIYNGGWAMVKDVRSINFDQGQSTLYFTDVSDQIDPRTVTFKALSNPKRVKVFEQNFQKNIIREQELVKSYIGKQIEIYADFANSSQKIKGKLLAFNFESAILQSSTGIGIYDNTKVLLLPGIPQGFYITPTLQWTVFSDFKATTDCEVSYRAKGLQWSVDYTLTLTSLQDKADVGAWVTIENESSKEFKLAKIKLIAGDVNFEQKDHYSFSGSGLYGGNSYQSAPSFSQQVLSDYHLYTFNRPATISPHSSKQIEFINKIFGVKVRKFYVVNIQSGGYGKQNIPVQNTIEFQNTKEQGLGIPLPKGIFRVFKESTNDGSLEFLGQKRIDHTPNNQKISIQTGKAFDITVNLNSETRNSQIKGYSSNMLLRISNQKSSKASIEVRIQHWGSGSIQMKLMNQSIILIKSSSRGFLFTVDVAAYSEIDVKWTQRGTGIQLDF